MKAANFKAEAKGKTLRLDIYDVIGPSWLGMIDAKSVARAIKDAGDVTKIDVHINSPGGDVWEGLAIHNMLKDHEAKVNVKVDGVAASSASVIAMAGDTVTIPKNALFMIHNPWTFAMGYESDLRKTADVLAKHKTAIIESYKAKTTKSDEEISKLMDDETWFTGAEAVEAGFADKTSAEISVSKTASAHNEITAMYRHAPSNFSPLAALASGTAAKEPPAMPEKTPEQIDAETKAAADAKAKTDAADLKAKHDAEVKAAADTERKRATDIVAVCKQAGKQDLAAGFVENGTDLAAVQAVLFKSLCDERKPTDDGKGGAVTETTDPNAGYKAEYAKNKAYAAAGMSEADYVATRRVDDGLDPLQKAKAS
jgi:ATP-dependent protease ClpP protease subunit